MQIWPKQKGCRAGTGRGSENREQASPTRQNVSLTPGQLLQGPTEDAQLLHLL